MNDFYNWLEENEPLHFLFLIAVGVIFAVTCFVVVVATYGLALLLTPTLIYAYYHLFVKGKEK